MRRLFIFAEFPTYQDGLIIPITARNLTAALAEAKSLRNLNLQKLRKGDPEGWSDQHDRFYLQDEFSADPYNEKDFRRINLFCQRLGFTGENLSIFMRSLM
jgi:hypothetical protein